MQLNMSLIINFFKRVFSGDNERKTQEVKPAAIKRTLPSAPINPMADEVENSNTVTHDLIHEIEKNKHIQDDAPDKLQDVPVEVKEQADTPKVSTEEVAEKAEAEIKFALEPEIIQQAPKTNPIETPPESKPVTKEPEKAKVAVKKETKTKLATKAASNAEPKAETATKTKPKAKPVAKAKTKAESKTETASKTKPKAKAKTKSTANSIPKTIVLDEAESSLTTKSKRIVGHCKNNPDSFKVTHIVKPDQEKLRLNLTLVGWKSAEGLSFVTYDIANDSIVFSKKCDDTSADQLNGVLLAWAREVHKSYY